jgi:hypothetical protein
MDAYDNLINLKRIKQSEPPKATFIKHPQSSKIKELGCLGQELRVGWIWKRDD